MEKIKSIGLSLVAISMLGIGFSGCGGEDSKGSEQVVDTQTLKTGYLVDSGIEGLRYTTSSGKTGTTSADGKYKFKDGDSVEFFLGDLKLGDTIKASEKPITPIELFDEKQKDYKDNTKVVNLLRLLQTLDSDNYHDNGIKIDSTTADKFKNVHSINLDDETAIQDTLKKNGITKNLVDETTAKINMDNSLMQISTNSFVTDSKKIKMFNRYYGAIFELEKKAIQEKTVSAIDSINQTTKLIQGAVDVTTSALDVEDKTVMTVLVNTTKELYKSLVGINGDLTSTQLASLNLFVDIITPILSQTSSITDVVKVLKSELAKSELAKADTYFGTLVGGLGITSSLSDDAMANNLTTITYNLRALMTLAKGSAKGYVFDAGKLIADGLIINADAIAKIRVLSGSTKAQANSIITQEYVRLYYQNGESDEGIINHFKTDKDIKKIFDELKISTSSYKNISQKQVISLIAKLSGFRSYTTLETSTMFLPWNWWSSELKFDEYDLEIIEDKIKIFKNNFQNYYANFKQYREGNIPPKAKLEKNYNTKIVEKDSIEVGDSIDFLASNSSDADGTIKHYDWYVEGSSLSVAKVLTDCEDETSCSISDLGAGSYQLILKVTDNDKAEDTTQLAFVVKEKEIVSKTTSSFIVKKTGQTTSYVDYDDGYYEKGKTPIYTQASDTVTDELTGLMWQDDEDAKSVTKTWEGAKTYCSDLTLSGYTDWRLPTSTELEGIVDYGHYNPAIDTDYFQNTSFDDYWSSSTRKYDAYYAWEVGFDDGGVYRYHKDGNNYVRCVRGGQ